MLEATTSEKKKKSIEKSRECHNHKPQPTPDTKRKRKRTETNTYKANKQMQEKHKKIMSKDRNRPTCGVARAFRCAVVASLISTHFELQLYLSTFPYLTLPSGNLKLRSCPFLGIFPSLLLSSSFLLLSLSDFQ